MKPISKSPNQTKFYDDAAISCSEALRATLHLVKQPLSPVAFCLNVYLASWVNKRASNGAVHPSDARIMRSLRVSPEQLSEAVSELSTACWWSRVGGEYRGIFLQEQWREELRRRVKPFAGLSMNHSKVVARYLPGSPMARALMLFIVSQTTQLANNLGYQHWVSAPTGNFRTKLFHGTFFECPEMRTQNPEGWQLLADTAEVPDKWLEKPIRASVNRRIFQQKVVCTDQQFQEAVEEVNALGWWKIYPDPFGTHDEWEATPQPVLHKLVWDFDQRAGGAHISQWEAENGFYESTGELPPLGYHYIYGLKVQGSEKFFLIGQTTQPLEQRLKQHLALGTNSDANAVIKAAVESSNQVIVIEQLATVFFLSVAEYEVGMALHLKHQGHPIQNKILDVGRNQRTVKLDSRFGANGVSRDELLTLLAKHGGNVVLQEKISLTEQGSKAA